MYVMGTPAPQGSKRHVGGGRMVESSKKVGPWREAVVAEAQRSGLAGKMMPGPVDVTLHFYLPRPAGHYGTGRNADTVKPSAPPHPAGKPDIDKLARSTLDALTQAGVIADDAQVVRLVAQKKWCDDVAPVPGASITVTPSDAHGQAVGLLLAREGTDYAGPRALPDPVLDGFRCVCHHPELPGAHSLASCRLPGQEES